MPRKKKKPLTDNGRPGKKIDWNLVDDLLLSGCQGTEIAPHFDIHPDTLYQRVAREKGMSFSDYSAQKKCQGESILRDVQFKKAIGAREKGDNSLLIWLGKNRLGQKETNEITVSPDTVKNFSNVMEQLSDLQSKRQNKNE
jgi:hypothetical protein